MAILPLDILYEDNHLLVVNKPPGLATQGAAEEATSLIAVAKAYIKSRYQKPGNVYLGVMSRLDQVVSGVVVLARTSKAAARLTEQFRTHAVGKTYWALTDGVLEPPAGELEDWLVKDELAQRMVARQRGGGDAKLARLAYRTLARQSGDSLLEIELETGRKHQIRVQLAERGRAILGDVKYGSRRKFANGIGLHSRELRLLHPVKQIEQIFLAPLPAAWPAFARQLAAGKNLP
jgi:23S rRNA pseudouridine1911/1915/1917 synthase